MANNADYILLKEKWRLHYTLKIIADHGNISNKLKMKKNVDEKSERQARQNPFVNPSI